MEWYFSSNGGQEGPVSDEQLATRFRNGELDGETLVWREGMADWQALRSARPDWFGTAEAPPSGPLAVCAVSGAVLPESEMLQYGDSWVAPEHKETFLQGLREGAPIRPSTFSAGGRFYQDPELRAKLAKIFIAIFTFFSIGITLIDLVTPDSAPEEFTSADGVLAIMGLAMVPALITSAVFFFMWTHRVVSNAHSFGTAFMTITPGWAVGWYFIPIASLWKPYSAMKETWIASVGSDSVSPAMPTWWALWIITNMMSNTSLRSSLNGLSEAALIMDSIGIILEIILIVAVFSVINQITRAQVDRASV